MVERYISWESSWPRPREYIDRNFQGIAPDVQRQIPWDNARNLYGIPEPA